MPSNILVFVKGEGVVLCEPSVVAIQKDTNHVLAVGEEAKRMLGRTPGTIVAIRPMKDGVIADFEITEAMLRYFIKKVHRRKVLVRPRMVIAIPRLSLTRQVPARIRLRSLPPLEIRMESKGDRRKHPHVRKRR